ncbi:toll/interleukin-1 receptor domain-containing protein [Frankia sp. Cj5]|uniref:toll/interleukin-1 receptor domain-containing protein n=1 Tax=Frankia sp. Cj5 TaxID=2880978 RepID=UPI001EF657B0|nr:toll/interleukin-1 receptor domain-containing protein [Frankia sp. Cj5]
MAERSPRRPVAVSRGGREDRRGAERGFTMEGRTGQPVELSLTDDERWELLHACARVAGTAAAAGMLLDQAGYPREYRPSWPGMTPVHWWYQVFAELDNGVIADPFRRLLRAALRVYPASPAFTAIAEHHGAACDDRPGAGANGAGNPSNTSGRPYPVGQPGLPDGRIFLCYSTSDLAGARALYARLRTDGLAPWLDDEDVLPGQEWEPLVRAVIRNSAAVLVCLTAHAMRRRDFIHKAIGIALDVASEQPEGATYIIPVRLENCAVPDRLRLWRPVDLFDARGYERLLRALRGPS